MGPKAEWVSSLRALCGPGADIRYNETVCRWEFLIPGADGVPRSQFWVWFDRPEDPVTGLRPFRELDDDGMRIALDNLTRTFVGNPWNGVGSTRKEVLRRYRQNRDAAEKHYREAGEQFSYLAAERGRRLRGAGFKSGYDPAPQSPSYKVVERRTGRNR